MSEIDAQVLASARKRIADSRKWDVQLTLTPPLGVDLRGSRVSVRLTRHAFRFGCNGFMLTVLEDPDLRQGYEERFEALLNYATLPFYWGRYEPERGVTIENAVRQMAAWCQERGIATKGHPLVWHEVFPGWANALPDEEVLRLQWQRVPDLVSGFRGSVDTWDVVNEATVSHRFDNAVGRWMSQQPAANVAEMLRLAHAANPGAELLYNDFNIRPPECEELIADLIDHGAPLSVIGLQSHMHRRHWPLEELWDICERYGRFGLPLHFTELTVLSGRPKDPDDRSNAFHPDWLTTPEGEEDQLRYGEAVYTLLYSHPAVEAITWWNLTDYRAWQGAPAGLVRADMSPKPLYERLVELVWDEWATRHEAGLGEGGTLTVPCAAGDHLLEVVLSSGDRLSGTFAVRKGKEGPINVLLAE